MSLVVVEFNLERFGLSAYACLHASSFDGDGVLVLVELDDRLALVRLGAQLEQQTEGKLGEIRSADIRSGRQVDLVLH